ncbi:MAG: 4Fe-4S dicluster domain-containing protein [bacterium]|nr:4Fe-4S dicluster domain-containing protein [bacterium]
MRNRTFFQTAVQFLTLAAFVLLLFLTVYPISQGFPYDFYLRLDPLAALGAWLGSGGIPAGFILCLFVVGLTLAGGRLFCGYLCPLGAIVDFSDLLIRGGKKSHPEENDRLRRGRNLKYYLLLTLLLSGFLGFSWFYVFDPISLITRSFTTFVYPAAIFLANIFLDLARPLARYLGLTGLAHASLSQPLYAANFVTFLVFAAILGLAYFSRRFWCRYLCPLGAGLGFLAWCAPVRRRVEAGCTECGRCRSACPMDAIPADPRRTVQAECTGCRACARVCPEAVVKFGWVPNPRRKEYRSEVDFSRRGFLAAAGTGLSLALLGRTNPARADHGPGLIRPPGAIPEPEFIRTCIRCGECLKSCITNTLQPAVFESGFEGLWTPRHQMRLAGCEQSCNVCGQVCPTQAIRALTLEEKKHARIGTAVIRKEKCIAWEKNRLCLICDEACPYNAIVFKMVEGRKRPFLDASKCNGCGICEKVCPIQGESAITVSSQGEIRLRRGSYREEARRRNLEFKSKELKDTFEEEPPGSGTVYPPK